MKGEIYKVLSAGDLIFLADSGAPVEVKKVTKLGIYTDKAFFTFKEHGEKYYLTHRGYEDSLKGG